MDMAFVVDGYSGVAVVEALFAPQSEPAVSFMDGVIGRVAATSAAARRALVALPIARTARCVFGPGVTVDDAAAWLGEEPVPRLVFLFHDGTPAVLRKVADAAMAVTAENGGRPWRGDPIPSALALGADQVTLRANQVEPDGAERPVASATRPVGATTTLKEAAADIAGVVARWLASWPGADRGGRPARAAPEPQGPRQSLADRLDWDRPAHAIVNLVRAWGHPAPGARTWWAGGPLTVSQASIVDGDALSPPGTVLAVDSAGVVVAAADRAVRVTGLRDIIGPVAPQQIQTGQRLGLDPVDEVVDLRRRIVDLENIVALLAPGMNLLGEPASPARGDHRV